MWYGSCCGKFSLPLLRQESRTNSLSAITSCPGWEINTPGRWLCPSPACQHRSTLEFNTTQFIMGGLSHAGLLQTTSEWIMGSRAKLRNQESTVQAAVSHLGRGSRAGIQAKGSYFAIMEEWLIKQKVKDLGRSLWCLAGERRRNQPWRCDGSWKLISEPQRSSLEHGRCPGDLVPARDSRGGRGAVLSPGQQWPSGESCCFGGFCWGQVKPPCWKLRKQRGTRCVSGESRLLLTLLAQGKDGLRRGGQPGASASLQLHWKMAQEARGAGKNPAGHVQYSDIGVNEGSWRSRNEGCQEGQWNSLGWQPVMVGAVFADELGQLSQWERLWAKLFPKAEKTGKNH